ncbi:MAG: carboxypeptidase-like regulatory domain-containing protein [Candidatus Poribacteria bacterium]|nr:carboxypeptidase-like regulatory domain-containing protein [Candidatus Poribacteria bacterium]
MDKTENDSQETTIPRDSVSIMGRILPAGIMPLIIVQRNGIDFKNTVADEEGNFTVPNLPVGEYSVRVIASGFFTDISMNHLELKVGETYVAEPVTLIARSEAATLLGLVVDKADNTPISDAVVHVECSTGVCALLSAASDQNGKFTIKIWSGLSSIFNVQKLGYQMSSFQVEALKPNEKHDLGKIIMERIKL